MDINNSKYKKTIYKFKALETFEYNTSEYVVGYTYHFRNGNKILANLLDKWQLENKVEIINGINTHSIC